MTLSFARRDDGYRAWFTVVRSNGTLRTGASSGDFTVTVADPGDAVGTAFVVSESAAKPGMYYFDVPSTYLVASGTGDYGITVEVNITSSPIVTTAFSDILKIAVEDFDTIAASVWNSQTASYATAGTFGDTIASLQSQGVSLTDLARELIVSSVWDANASTFNVSGTMGWLQGLIDTINVQTSQSYAIVNSFQTSGVSVDQSAVDNIVTGVWDATAGTFNTAGTMGRLQNTAGAGGVDIDLLVSGIWNAGASGFNTSGTMGWLANRIQVISGSIETIRKVESGRWLISGSQQIFYDDDGSTPVFIYNLFKPDGTPFTHDADAVVERVPTGSLA